MYVKFGLMIATSTVVMFILMYLNTYAWEHLYFSETRTYMAVLMGATMAIIMLAYMLGMYESRKLNIAIFVGASVVFALSLWLVRSQVTVSGTSYMRAMIPHHSIAVTTSERAQIRDPRVRKLADEIIGAQRREVAEMQYLIAQTSAGNTVKTIYEDPPAKLGTIEDALNNTLISRLDPAPMPEAEADQVLNVRERCRFNRSPEADPILWAASNGSSAGIKLNGVLVALEPGSGEPGEGHAFESAGASIVVRELPEGEADWRQEAELVFKLDEGLTVGYRGFWSCQ